MNLFSRGYRNVELGYFRFAWLPTWVTYVSRDCTTWHLVWWEQYFEKWLPNGLDWSIRRTKA